MLWLNSHHAHSVTDGKRQNEAERRDAETDEAYMIPRVAMIFSEKTQESTKKWIFRIRVFISVISYVRMVSSPIPNVYQCLGHGFIKFRHLKICVPSSV